MYIEEIIGECIDEGDYQRALELCRQHDIKPLYTFDDPRYYSNYYKFITYVLQQGEDPNEIINDDITPFMYAVLREDKKLVEIMINYGADPHKRDMLGRSAWSLANKELRSLML